MSSTVFVAALILVAVFFVSSRYKRANKGTAFILSGYDGEKILLDKSAFALPVLQQVIPVNLKTQCLNIKAKDNLALLTNDHLKLDISVDFYIRVPADEKHILKAGRSLGKLTTKKTALKKFLKGKLESSLRQTAISFSMLETLQQQENFAEKIHSHLEPELQKNGLLLESVSIQTISPTAIDFYQEANLLEKQAKTQLISKINAELKNQEIKSEQLFLEIEKKKQTMRLEQEKQINLCRIAIESDVAKEQLHKRSELSKAELAKQHELELEKQSLETELEKQRQEQLKLSAEIQKTKEIALAEQETEFELARKKQLAESETRKVLEIAQAEKKAAEIFAEAERIKVDAKIKASQILNEIEKQKFDIAADGIKQINSAIDALCQSGFPERLQDNLISVISGLVDSKNDPVLRSTSRLSNTQLVTEQQDNKSISNKKRDKLQALLNEANNTINQGADLSENFDLEALANTPPLRKTGKVGLQ